MKKLFLIFILFISCNSDNKKTLVDNDLFFNYIDFIDDEFIELNGDVEKIYFTNYGVQNKFDESLKFINEAKRYYFEEGRLASYTENFTNSKGFLITKNYNDEGLVISEKIYIIEDFDELYEESSGNTSYEYNSDGYLSKIVYSESTGRTYDYNEKGLKIKSTYYNTNYPERNTLNIYEYDSEDEIKKVTRNNIPTEYTRLYDEKNNLKESREFTNGIQTSLTQREYDQNQNLIKEVDYNKDGKVSRTRTFKYENNRTIELTDSSYEIKFKFNYDEKGNISEIVWYEIGGDLPIAIYEWVYIYK